MRWALRRGIRKAVEEDKGQQRPELRGVGDKSGDRQKKKKGNGTITARESVHRHAKKQVRVKGAGTRDKKGGRPDKDDKETPGRTIRPALREKGVVGSKRGETGEGGFKKSKRESDGKKKNTKGILDGPMWRGGWSAITQKTSNAKNQQTLTTKGKRRGEEKED